MALLALEIRRDLEALRAEVAQLKAELAAESSERD
jgi:hypothetical protein